MIHPSRENRIAFCLPKSMRRYDLDTEGIPERLKGISRWVLWRGGEPKTNGKFDKVPIDVATGKNVNANDLANWLSFQQAHNAYQQGLCSGIGFVLSTEPIEETESGPLYLIAVDLDNCRDRIEEVKHIRSRLSNTFIEISPSGKGVHLFGLSHKLIRGGNDGNGHEIYSSGRFMTVTGKNGRGALQEVTEALVELEREYFSTRPQIDGAKNSGTLNAEFNVHIPNPETNEKIALVWEQLGLISADCDYETWRNIIWSLLSTGWSCAKEIAEEWSQSSPHCYNARSIASVVRSFDPNSGITLGTLDFHARKAGWSPGALAEPVEVGSRSVRRLLRVDEIMAMPPISWIVRGVLPTRGLAAIFGAPGSGKTFLALDLACSIAASRPNWFGAKISPAPVVYLALEGETGIRQRIIAWEKENQPLTTHPLRFTFEDFNLVSEREVNELALGILDAVGKHTVVFIDTLNRSAPGADENSSVDMGRLIKNATFLADTLEGMTVLVHHSGKKESNGMRGHSLLLGAMDAVIEVSAKASLRTWKIAKSKDGETGIARIFDLRSHHVDQDDDGLPISSCAVKPSLLVSKPGNKQVTGKNQIAAMKILTSLQLDHPDGIPLATAQAAVGHSLTCAANRQKPYARELIQNLTETGHLLIQNERVHIA